MFHSQNKQSNRNISFTAASSVYGDDIEDIMSISSDDDKSSVELPSDYSKYSTGVDKIRSEIKSKSGTSKILLEVSLTALVAATTILGIKKGMDASQNVIKKVTDQGKNIVTSDPVRTFFSAIKNFSQSTFNKLDTGLNNQSQKSKSFIVKSGVNVFNKFKNGIGDLYDGASKIFKGAKNIKSVQKIAKFLFIEGPKIAASACIGTFLTLTAIENIIDPFMDKMFDKKTTKETSSADEKNDKKE